MKRLSLALTIMKDYLRSSSRQGKHIPPHYAGDALHLKSVFDDVTAQEGLVDSLTIASAQRWVFESDKVQLHLAGCLRTNQPRQPIAITKLNCRRAYREMVFVSKRARRQMARHIHSPA
jgi:hypothetical protein